MGQLRFGRERELENGKSIMLVSRFGPHRVKAVILLDANAVARRATKRSRTAFVAAWSIGPKRGINSGPGLSDADSDEAARV